MKTTKASTNANTYKEYLEQREKELQEEVEFWHRAWKDTRAENAALKERVAELEAERDGLQDRVVDLEECVWDINGYAWVADTENAALQDALEEAKRKLEESVSLSAMNELEGMLQRAEAERDAIQADGEELLEENKALTLEKADLIREKHAAESRAELAECFLDMTHDVIDAAASVARGSGDYKGQMEYLAEVAKHFKL